MNERVIRKSIFFIQITNKIYLAFIHNYRYAWDVGWIYKTESMSKTISKRNIFKHFFMRQLYTMMKKWKLEKVLLYLFYIWTIAGCFAERYIIHRSCRFEGLYSIIVEGYLRASSGEVLGERTLTNAPAAVYVHELKKNAENYVSYAHLFEDSTFWCCMWEVKVDRNQRVIFKHGTNQWLQQKDSVELKALWVRGVSAEKLISGESI